MALDPAKNFAKVTVSIGYGSEDTSIVLSTGDGAKLPDPSVSGAFNLVWWNVSDYSDPADDPNKEIVRCTARSSDTLTVTRAQESTSATTKNTSAKTYKMILALTAKMITDIGAAYEASGATATHAALTTGVHGVGASTVAKTADITTHSDLTTGVHGVGAGTVAKTSDITATKLDDFTAPDDNTDLNASTSKHGLVVKATAPSAGLVNVVGIENGETAYTNKALFDATSPSTQAFGDSAATGTATVAARRDHKHGMPASSGATTALDNLASVAINTSLISDTDNTDDLGSLSKKWKDGYFAGNPHMGFLLMV
jgi:hypothetical protein